MCVFTQGLFVAVSVSLDLLSPEMFPRSRPSEKSAGMSVPKAAMHKYYRSESFQNNIGAPRKSAIVKSKSVTRPMQGLPDCDFYLRVLSADFRHDC
jgi:hypothetical protein